MKMIELFSGSCKVSRVFHSHGWDTFTVDWDKNYNPDLCCSVYDLNKDFLSTFDFIWLSPDCTTYSLAAHGLHRNKGLPLSDYAKFCDKNNRELFFLLKDIDKPFICENPRGYMRQMDFVKDLYRKTVYYSSFGSKVTKPTDLFSNKFEILFCLNSEFKKGSVKLDSIPYSNFLGRCDIPVSLIEFIIQNLDNYFF